ncbi:UNKNOWN [Stylonychia lemnae]|uniref:Uncharacterized protein n=1 Tax=Stylonychia lemnae TaxID=5949 RepID=A0A077ZQC6_STYLE|nr:UNKNOWN [Stylonychia lemnae]|eukprot:CDW72102.1 UNKNOWN [Stylonychia lemnae]
MNSNNQVYSDQNGSYLGALVVYVLIAAMFFMIGRNYDRIRSEVQSRNPIKKQNKVNTMTTSKTTKTGKEKYLEKNLEESKNEIKQLSSELSRMRQRDQSLSAENQILKSKLMNQQHDLASQLGSSAVLIGNQQSSDDFIQVNTNMGGGSRENPIHVRYEESKSIPNTSSNTNTNNQTYLDTSKSSKAGDQQKQTRKKSEDNSPMSEGKDEDDLVNEIDNFLIEDDDL